MLLGGSYLTSHIPSLTERHKGHNVMSDKESDGTQRERAKEPVDCVDKDASQSDKFKKAAREHEADEDEKHWEERLRKVAKPKPQDAP
jgi:hypothetical protein